MNQSAVILIALLFFAGCAERALHSEREIAEVREVDSSDAAESSISSFKYDEDRLKAIRSAKIFVDQQAATELDFLISDPSLADMKAGPRGTKHDWFEPEEPVTCTFAQSGTEMNGNTPKFRCSIVKPQSDGTADLDTFKVKFKRDNHEVGAAIVATRLFWSLGFFADRNYPVSMTCLECPADPSQQPREKSKRRVIENAMIERKFGFHIMGSEGKTHQGWSWKEFDLNQSPLEQRDALRLLAAFIKHGDNKPEQQHLVCPKKKIVATPDGHLTCQEPYMLIHDLGGTFGGAGRTSSGDSGKLNVKQWEKSAVWKNPTLCIAGLTKSLAAHDGLENPRVSEEGRQFLLKRLKRLTPAQTFALFKVARFSDEESNNWNRVFWAKVSNLEFPMGIDHPEFKCPAMGGYEVGRGR